MKSTEDWIEAICRKQAVEPDPIAVHTKIGDIRGDHGRAIPIIANDGQSYWIKALRREGQSHAGRSLLIEQLVARLGSLIGAPVIQAKVVTVTETFLKLAELQCDFYPGTAHASVHLEGFKDTKWDYGKWKWVTRLPSNRARCAALAVLYGWVVDNYSDQQLLYEIGQPHRFFAHDHGLLAKWLGIWPENDVHLSFAASLAYRFLKPLQVGEWAETNADFWCIPEIRGSLTNLRGVAQQDIAWALASCDPAWGVSLVELAKLADYLWRRRGTLVRLLDEWCPPD